MSCFCCGVSLPSAMCAVNSHYHPITSSTWLIIHGVGFMHVLHPGTFKPLPKHDTLMWFWYILSFSVFEFMLEADNCNASHFRSYFNLVVRVNCTTYHNFLSLLAFILIHDSVHLYTQEFWSIGPKFKCEMFVYMLITPFLLRSRNCRTC